MPHSVGEQELEDIRSSVEQLLSSSSVEQLLSCDVDGVEQLLSCDVDGSDSDRCSRAARGPQNEEDIRVSASSAVASSTPSSPPGTDMHCSARDAPRPRSITPNIFLKSHGLRVNLAPQNGAHRSLPFNHPPWRTRHTPRFLVAVFIFSTTGVVAHTQRSRSLTTPFSHHR